MARKARHRISYVLPLANAPGGHRLGVNGLAIDSTTSILYTGGRDGLICAWDLGLALDNHNNDPVDPFASPEDASTPASPKSHTTKFRSQVQAHTHWINDILLTKGNSALVSASSDLTVKVWRPHSDEKTAPMTIGSHSDYVKCLASPGVHAEWVASGGLDHKIKLWDLNGGGETLGIDIGDIENSAKGSVYALSVRGSIMASGGPESIVRLWDPRSGKAITKFVGHTDNIRDILINHDGDTVMTASSDQSIKVWSITAGRCMYTLTMHNDSVWSLHSDHPQLSVFYSADRSGLIAKTDVRGCEDMDEGLSLAVAHEHEGVSKLVVAGAYIWTATSSSSINRWSDVDTRRQIQSPEQLQRERASSLVARSIKIPSSPPKERFSVTSRISSTVIPLSCVLRISNSAPPPGQKSRDAEASTVYSGIGARKLSEAIAEPDLEISLPYHDLPEETIEGQNGLIKHMLLNDRRRVLALDTAGEVTMWDLIKCGPIQSFGKRYLEDVAPEVNTVEVVPNWCGVDTRTGRLAVVLEENYCFDAEMYADEWNLEVPSDFRDDQRINLGKWILRFLFAEFIEEELHRDAIYRKRFVPKQAKSNTMRRDNAPSLISLPQSSSKEASKTANERGDHSTTSKSQMANGITRNVTTPGLTIGVATPHPNGPLQGQKEQQSHLPPTVEEELPLEKRTSQVSQARSSTDKPADYFTASGRPKTPLETLRNDGSSKDSADTSNQSAADGDKEEKTKEGSSRFSKKFRMNFPKKLGGRNSLDTKPATVDEKSEESDRSDDKEDKAIQDNLFGVIQKIRHEYDLNLHPGETEPVATGIVPSTLNETPLLRLPINTTVIIQEEKADSGGVADLYQGTIDTLGNDADLIEKAAPMWLGELLLRNRLPPKEIQKVSFILLPHEDSLPSIASSDGNNRLNANRMLRAKKILAYVAERIEAQPEEADPNAMKPEEYLELYCHDQLVDHDITLATLRSHVWKTGGDIVLYYKSNGRRPELAELVNKRSSSEGTAKTGPILTHST